MGKLKPTKQAWLKRKKRVRRRVKGTAQRPRLNVFRSTKHMYVQIIDDAAGRTLAAASTLSPDFKASLAQAEAQKAEAQESEAEAEKSKKGKAKKVQPELKGKVRLAREVGLLIAQKAKAKGINQVVFDRNGFLFHGRVKAVADGARQGGLEF
ncbi:MAG: 50S ribosomal protein L18 [Deltaproteobacteria bacterium]|nr:50S ribosomal protein L18 [Deltaproteobacteria bacterium]